MPATTTSYSGRQIDIEFMQTVTRPAASIPLSLSWQGGPVKAVTGMQKLAQRYTVILLTKLGDVRFDAEFGTTFWADMLRGAAQNSGQIAAAMAFINSDILQILRREDADVETYGAIPDDERLAQAQLINFTVNSTTATMNLNIQLTNVRGTTYTYVIPVATAGG